MLQQTIKQTIKSTLNQTKSVLIPATPARGVSYKYKQLITAQQRHVSPAEFVTNSTLRHISGASKYSTKFTNTDIEDKIESDYT